MDDLYTQILPSLAEPCPDAVNATSTCSPAAFSSSNPKSDAEKRFLERWRLLSEPKLQVKVYLTNPPGRKGVMLGSVEVPLASLADGGYLHDLWLNLQPCTKLPMPRNDAERKFLEKWTCSEIWGSIHLLIQKNSKEKVNL